MKEISETYTFQTNTALYGGFSIERYVRDRVEIRWNVSLVGMIGFVLYDQSGEVLFRGTRPINQNHMVNPTQDFQEYLIGYKPVEVTIKHFLDDRKRDLGLEVRLLVTSEDS